MMDTAKAIEFYTDVIEKAAPEIWSKWPREDRRMMCRRIAKVVVAAIQTQSEEG